MAQRRESAHARGRAVRVGRVPHERLRATVRAADLRRQLGRATAELHCEARGGGATAARGPRRQRLRSQEVRVIAGRGLSHT